MLLLDYKITLIPLCCTNIQQREGLESLSSRVQWCVYFLVPREEREESVYRLMTSFLVRNCLSVKTLETQKWLGNAQLKKGL